MLMTADTLLTGRELLRPAWIEVSDGAVSAVGAGPAPRPADRDLGGATVTPGFSLNIMDGGVNDYTQARHHHTRRVPGHRRARGPAASGRGVG